MRNINEVNSSKYFLLVKPENLFSPLIVSSPHSGRYYDKKFLELTGNRKKLYNQIEDMYVDQLVEDFHKYGSTLLSTKVSRAVIDLNRDKNEIDTDLVKNLPEKNFYKSIYVKSGIGLFPRLSRDYNELYVKDFLWKEAKLRINKYYKPWHFQLRSSIESIRSKFNFCLLMDYHSMPSNVQNKITNKNQIVIGNNYGKSCNESLTNFVKNSFMNKGYIVAINKPYAGGYITRNYSNLDQNINTLQIEICRSLYMNENTFKKNSNFLNLKNNLNLIMQDILEYINDCRSNKNIAAE